MAIAASAGSSCKAAHPCARACEVARERSAWAARAWRLSPWRRTCGKAGEAGGAGEAGEAGERALGGEGEPESEVDGEGEADE